MGELLSRASVLSIHATAKFFICAIVHTTVVHTNDFPSTKLCIDVFLFSFFFFFKS